MISEDRQSHLAHIVVDGIWKQDLVEYTDEEMAMRMAKKAVTAFFQELDNVDDVVRKKIMSLKRTVMEGTPEWEILYKKYTEEEMNRRGTS